MNRLRVIVTLPRLAALLVFGLLVALVAREAQAQATGCNASRPCYFVIRSGNSATKAGVNNQGALEVVTSTSTKATYIASTGSQALTALDSLANLEATDNQGFRITKICIAPGVATAGASTLVQVIRRTTASALGVAVSAEVTTGTNSLAKMNPADSNWTGVFRIGGTEGTAGAILDSFNVHVGQTGAANGQPSGMICKEYCNGGYEQCPKVPSGTANGVSVMFTGTAGGTGQSASITFIPE
jgi:hypothetical protein